MKYTVANNELNLGGKNGLYCFLPYERLDDEKKAIFKCGMTTQDFVDRLENYHSYHPMGVYMCFFLSPAWIKRSQDKKPYEKWSIFCLIVLKKQVANA